MKKIIIGLLILALSVGVLASCAKEESDFNPLDPFAQYKDVNFSEYLNLADFSKLTVSEYEIEPTEEAVQERMAQNLQSVAQTIEVTDRAAKNGDTVIIDFAGKLDDQSIDTSGGKMDADDFTLTNLGSYGMIDGFEEGIVGMMPGEEKTIHIYFPDPYPNNTALNGQGVSFTIKLKAIQETVIPELTDELVKENSDYSTVDEWLEAVREDLREENDFKARDGRIQEAWNYFLDNSEVIKDYDDTLKFYYDSYVKSYADRVESSGFADLKTMLEENYGVTEEEFYGYAKSYSESMFKQEFILAALQHAENIVVTQEMYNESGETLAADSKFESLQALIDQYGVESVSKTITSNIIIEHMIEKYATVVPKSTETAE